MPELPWTLSHWALIIGLMASMIDFLTHGLVDASYFVVDLAFVFMLTLALVQKVSKAATDIVTSKFARPALQLKRRNPIRREASTWLKRLKSLW